MLLLLYILCLVNIFEFGVAQQYCLPGDKVCDNKECVLSNHWCDGKIHCKDGSDETIKCLEQRCKRNSFRCKYGACIDENLKCNGANDCNDGSDEIALECSAINMKGNCSDFEVQCQNLQCIPQENACDAKLDCADGSDETKKTCLIQQCPHYSFRCAYGGCIPIKKKCDNNIDCIDGSDETNCVGRIDEISLKLPTLTQRITDVINTNYYSNNEGDTECNVPKDDFLALIDDDTNLQLRPGTNSTLGTSITYVCSKNTFLVGKHKTNFCDGRYWVNEQHPRCLKRCPPINGYTIKPVCELNGAGVPCNEPVKIGTMAKIHCEVMYEKPDRHVDENIQCQDDGNWDYEPFKCEQLCGIVESNVAFSVNSEITEVHRVPWNVGIYKRNKDGKFDHICGGTLIRSKIIVSAAHCFWDSTTRKIFDKSNYKITVGKFYRDFSATNETAVFQTKTISKIDIPHAFNDQDYDYISDIAVLTLDDHIKFNSHVRPACLRWKEGNERYVTSGIDGIVAGWGITDGGALSPVLRSVELETIDYATCVKRKPNPTDRIANDKFCVETSQGKNVCSGDSGGGFVVAESYKNVKQFYLWGLVSSGIVSRKDGIVQCNSNFITGFTNIQLYDTIVKQAITNAYK